MKWRKVPGHLKWAGYSEGRHCATFQQDSQGRTRAWVDGGRGFQEIIDISLGVMPAGIAAWKRFCEFALERLLAERAKEANNG